VILVAHSFCLRRDRKQFERSKPYAPLATLLAAAILRERGHPVALFDANFNYLTKMCTEDRRADALHIVAAARKAGARVAVNGPDASDNPRLYLEAGADAVMTGEGELGAAAIVDAFQSGAPLDAVSGLILLEAGELRYTPPRRQEQALDDLPFPAWDLIDVAAYRETWTRAHGHFSWNMAASRGCPYS
jgi:anaerobic magnesium-protoporphyrin IX monomethyl ester cyclase